MGEILFGVVAWASALAAIFWLLDGVERTWSRFASLAALLRTQRHREALFFVQHVARVG